VYEHENNDIFFIKKLLYKYIFLNPGEKNFKQLKYKPVSGFLKYFIMPVRNKHPPIITDYPGKGQ